MESLIKLLDKLISLPPRNAERLAMLVLTIVVLILVIALVKGSFV